MVDQWSQARYCVVDPSKVLVLADTTARSRKTASLNMVVKSAWGSAGGRGACELQIPIDKRNRLANPIYIS